MRSIKVTNKPLSLHRSTAEQSLPRALQVLRTLGTDSAIRTAMQKVGFELSDLQQGWTLVLKACSAPAGVTQLAPDAGPVQAATQKIEAWQSTMFLRAHAALRRLHPQQDAFVFDNIVTGSGTSAVVAVSMFLERLDALESAAERKSTRKADHAALATLERRGVTKEERKQVHELVRLVETTPAPELVDVAPPTDERTAALTELYAWVQDWSDCARAVITRRNQLIRLGIGKRRARGASDVTPPPEPTPAPAQIAQMATAAIAALPPKPNGVPAGAIAIPSLGGAHG